MNLEKPWHILVLIIIAVVLFGSKRLPDSARSLGRSLRIFKSEMKELNKDDNDPNGEKKPNSNN